jgi:hypothetical protein
MSIGENSYSIAAEFDDSPFGSSTIFVAMIFGEASSQGLVASEKSGHWSSFCFGYGGRICRCRYSCCCDYPTCFFHSNSLEAWVLIGKESALPTTLRNEKLVGSQRIGSFMPIHWYCSFFHIDAGLCKTMM